MFSINGTEFDVVYVHPMSRELMRSDGSRTVGMCDLTRRKIFISDMLQGAFLRKVLIHEICHAAMCCYSINMSMEQEELFCDLLATYGDEIIGIADDIFRALKKRVA